MSESRESGSRYRRFIVPLWSVLVMSQPVPSDIRERAAGCVLQSGWYHGKVYRPQMRGRFFMTRLEDEP